MIYQLPVGNEAGFVFVLEMKPLLAPHDPDSVPLPYGAPVLTGTGEMVAVLTTTTGEVAADEPATALLTAELTAPSEPEPELGVAVYRKG